MLARNSYGLGWRSNTLSFTTVSVPPTPTNSSYDTRSVTLEWDAYAGTGIGAVTNYSVTLCTTPYADITKSIACEGESRVQYAGDALTTTVGGLTPGETYAFTVQGFTTAWSGPSNPLTITTRPDVPDAPPAPTAGALLRTRSVGLVWAAPTADNGEPFTGITLKQSPASADGTASYPLGADARALNVSGLRPATTYTFTLVASNVLGPSPESVALDVPTCAEEPDALAAAPTFADATTSSITVAWSTPEYDNGAAISKYRVTATPGGATAETSDASTSMTVDNLTPGVAYTFTVKAYNGVMRGVDGDCAAEGGSGWGPESAGSAAMYTKPVKPAAPSTVSLHSDAQGTSLTVDWDRPYYNGANITNYTVYSNASAGGAAMVKAVPADPATGIPPLFQLFPRPRPAHAVHV